MGEFGKDGKTIRKYVEGEVSLGKAAEIAGVSKWEMLDMLAMRKVLLQYYPEDLEEDIDTLRSLK